MSATQTLLLDIETSGLSRERDHLISIGLAPLGQAPTFLFINSPEDEKAVLEAFLAYCNGFDTLYAYAGKRFDYPFLLARLNHYEIDTTPFLKLKLIDIKKVLTPFGANRQDLEKHFDFTRKSSSTGRDMVKLYRTFVASKNELYRELILAHQQDEMDSLQLLASLYDMLAKLKCATNTGFAPSPSALSLTYTLSVPFPHGLTYETMAFSLAINKETPETLSLVIPTFTGSLKHYLTPVKDYYFIETENKLMHKSLASFLPATMRRHATKEECYIAAEGTYIQIFNTYKVNFDIWYDEAELAYMGLEDFSPENYLNQLFYFFFQTYIKAS